MRASHRPRWLAYAIVLLPLFAWGVGWTATPPQRRVQAHATLTHDLFHGEVVESAPFGANGNRQSLYRLSLRNPRTGRLVSALFKPRPWGDADGWNRTPMEYVAYELNLLLGMDYVPPVAYRRNINVHFRTWAEGALLYFAPDSEVLGARPMSRWRRDPDLFLSDTRILDVMLLNSDRHGGNLLFGRHWASDTRTPLLIDHGAGLRSDASVTLEHENAFQTGPVRVARLTTLRHLERLDYDSLTHVVGEFTSSSERRDMLHRQRGILQYFDRLQSSLGGHRVVLDVDDSP